MAPLVPWNPATKISRGNVAVGIATVIADINIPKVTELNNGITLSCSVNTFNGSSSMSSETIDWLCDPASETIPGSLSHEIDDLVIKSSGQSDAALVTALAIGDVVYIWRRDGLAHATAPAIGQFIWVWKAIITSIDPLEANNTFVGITAHVLVQARSRTAVALVA